MAAIIDRNRTLWSRWGLPFLIVAPLIGVIILACGGAHAAPPDSLYINGHVYTVDETRRWVEAIAVTGDTITAVGTNVSLTASAGPKTRIVDLGGRMVMPGIHDAHTHLLMAGLKWTYECRLPQNAGREAVVAAVRACADKAPGDDWIVAGEYNPNAFGEAPINNAFLDAAFPDRPVFLYEFSIHHALVNSKALALAGITRDSPDPPKGRIGRDPLTGELTGELIEMATVLATRMIPPYPDEAYATALRFAIDNCHKFGITSIQESSATRRLLQLYRKFDNAGTLNLWVMAHIVWGSNKWGDATSAELDKLISERATFATRHIDVDATKVWMDGAPLPPYFSQADIDTESGKPDPKNLLVSTEVLTERLVKWRAAGIKPKIHVAGAGAARVALDAIELAYGGPGNLTAPRPDLAHSDIIADADVIRYAPLGVIAEMSPAIWHLGDVAGFEVVNDWWPFASLLKSGAQMTIGSDWTLPPDPNLFPALEGAVTRRKQAVSLVQAIDMMTRNGAASVGQADRFGTVEVGKLANLIVLDRDLFAIEPSEIGETRVLMTVFEGRPVHVDPAAPESWRDLAATPIRKQGMEENP